MPQWTAPVLGDFAWVNESTTTTDTSVAGQIFIWAAGTGGVNVRGLFKAAPAAPYTIIAAFQPYFGDYSGQHCGLFWRDSVLGTLQEAAYAFEATTPFHLYNYTSPTVYLSETTAQATWNINPALVWQRIADDGTNRSVSFSNNGVDWTVAWTGVRTTFLTPDQVGFGLHPYTTLTAGMRLMSWAES